MRSLIVISVLLATGCQTIRLDRPVRPRAGDWITTGASSAHNTRTDVTISPPLVRSWEYNAEAAFGPGGGVVVSDVLLVGTRRGELHAVSLEKGKRKGVVKFKEPIEGTPVLHAGKLFLATSWGSRTVYAFDLERGRRVWGEKTDPVESGPVLVDGTLVVATVTGEVTGRDPEDGTVRWTAEPSGGAISSTPVSADGRTVVVADQVGRVRALRVSDGSEVWAAEVGAPVYEALTAIGNQVTVPTTRGKILGLDAGTGRVRWQYSTSDGRVHFGPAAGDAERIVFGATDGRIRAVSPRDGSLLWMATLSDGSDAQPLVSGEVVWIGTLGRELAALDATDGSVLWTLELPGRVRSALTVHEGGIIVLSEPRTVTYLVPGEVGSDE